MMPLSRLTEMAEDVLSNVRKTAQYVPPTRRDLINNLALSRRSIPGEGLPARPSGGSSGQLDQSTLDFINVSAMPRLDYRGRGEGLARQAKLSDDYLEKQARLMNEAQPANFKRGTYDQSKVVGETFEQQRSRDYIGMGGMEPPSSATQKEALGLNRVVHPRSPAADKYVPVSLTGGRDFGPEYVAQQEALGYNRVFHPGSQHYDTVADDYYPVALTGGRDFGPEYAAQQEALARQEPVKNINDLFGPQSISDLFQTKAARDFQYQSGVQGMESPGFRLTPEQEARLYEIEDMSQLVGVDAFRRVAKNTEIAEANAMLNPNNLGDTSYDLPAMRNQEVLNQVGYNEAAHTNANLATATENVTEGASSGNFTQGRLNIGGTQATNSLLGSLDRAGAEGMLATMGLGAVLGGTANYAMGGEFGEGAMMGGLAGGGISIGARAIRANAQGIEGYLQRQVLGDAANATDRAANATAIANMDPAAVSNLSVGGRMARSALMRNPETASLQSRHMVVGGSMLAGVAFTGRRNDKRRGFNAHRGNRI